MNVWMRWSKKQSRCRYCNDAIETATPTVVCRYWSNHKCYNIFYHPQCWVNYGMDYLLKNPYEAKPRGRKAIKLNPEDSRQRFLLLRRYSTTKHRLDKVRLESPEKAMYVLRLEKRLEGIVNETEKVGGIPTRWAQ